MKKSILGGIFALLTFSACQNSNTVSTSTNELKIVSVNGSVTEAICALGLEENIVGVDVTSVFPESIKNKPKVGHNRNISIEGIVSLQPNVVVGTELELTEQLQQQLKDAHIRTLYFERKYTVEDTKDFLVALGDSLGVKGKGEELANQIKKDVAEAKKITDTVNVKPKVLFIYSRGAGSLMVAGDDTPFSNIITLAGAQSAIAGFEGFKPLTTEAIVDANPDVILLFDSGLEALGGMDGVIATPGIALTNAGKNKKIIHMEGGLLSNFGPRLGLAIKELASLIHAK